MPDMPIRTQHRFTDLPHAGARCNHNGSARTRTFQRLFAHGFPRSIFRGFPAAWLKQVCSMVPALRFCDDV
ncbi:hypothetical protein RSPO_c02185 [Ralstonia solanacearum Po82]|uniref:Uncharacterized protein n=1 Tax=Ralstonia solanacearum (strain Po82) TaxID=1031711 RepID=F6G347_RALS8|nr:hypothetical protein RSPO_c02185 [Ralstonia solanacearum Po82]